LVAFRVRLILAIPAFVADALRRQMELNGSDDLVFTTGTGTPIDPGNIRRAWRQAREGSSLEWVTPHTIRRTVATLLSKGPAGLTGAQEQLGHSDARITTTHYIEHERVAADNAVALRDLLGPKVETESGDH
ncbi:MAG: tyrosine-type recombinase/integrase, partial [Mycetocola sp.]